MWYGSALVCAGIPNPLFDGPALTHLRRPGTLNLFVTGLVVKKYGPRFALVLQTVVPAIRVATQVLGVIAGGEAGIMIIQVTQLITILGGPSGYM